jgi:hypothetical protein
MLLALRSLVWGTYVPPPVTEFRVIGGDPDKPKKKKRKKVEEVVEIVAKAMTTAPLVSPAAIAALRTVDETRSWGPVDKDDEESLALLLLFN